MFDAAARHLNFRLAAEELNLTQGAVAQQVRRLEAQLGCALFHRKARGLAFTRAGERYHSSIRDALHVIDEATQELRSESAVVTLSVTPSFASKWLVPRLTRFAALRPEIDLQIVASERLADFHSDNVDIAIRQTRPPFDAGHQNRLLSRLDLCAACAPGYERTIAPVRELSDFTELTLIQDGHRQWDKLFKEAGLFPRRRILQFNQIGLAMDAAANGQGVALAPQLLLGDEVAKGNLKILWRSGAVDESGYYVATARGHKASQARAAVIEWLFSEVKSEKLGEAKLAQ